MWTRAILVGTAGALWLGASLAGAQPPPAPQGKGPGQWQLDRMTRALGLNADQKAAFQKILDQQKPQLDALHNEMRDNRQKLEDALKVENPDPATVGALAIQQHRLMLKGRGLHDQVIQGLHALLTPEQVTKLDALQAMGPFGAGGRMGHRGMGPMGPGAGAPPEQ